MLTTKKSIGLLLCLAAITLLTSCGKTKSNDEVVTSSASISNISAQNGLASCNQLANSNFNFNISTVTDSTGQVNPNWIKINFRFLASSVTQSGYTLKFFKWRMLGATAQLDSTPLTIAAYNLATGQSSSNTQSNLTAAQVTRQLGYYLQLNDDAQNPYQALKIVAYKADGSVLAQSDVLIPQFAASPNDYKVNDDGTQRASNLIALHPLAATDVSTWTTAQFQQNFSKYCF